MSGPWGSSTARLATWAVTSHNTRRPSVSEVKQPVGPPPKNPEATSRVMILSWDWQSSSNTSTFPGVSSHATPQRQVSLSRTKTSMTELRAPNCRLFIIFGVLVDRSKAVSRAGATVPTTRSSPQTSKQLASLIFKEVICFKSFLRMILISPLHDSAPTMVWRRLTVCTSDSKRMQAGSPQTCCHSKTGPHAVRKGIASTSPLDPVLVIGTEVSGGDWGGVAGPKFGETAGDVPDPKETLASLGGHFKSCEASLLASTSDASCNAGDWLLGGIGRPPCAGVGVGVIPAIIGHLASITPVQSMEGPMARAVGTKSSTDRSPITCSNTAWGKSQNSATEESSDSESVLCPEVFLLATNWFQRSPEKPKSRPQTMLPS
mmetsp:Transcript_31644/g.67852  ORF Transcript_31644/g.67852 Transcript_31644/m.67852 type:complete len:375 (+) Transcript_31644:747-1871(+)